jgi:hypothetical protein
MVPPQIDPVALWVSAHHEAAHAVVGTLLGGRVQRVEVWGGPPAGGRTEIAGLDDSAIGHDPYGPVRRMTCLVAASVAGRIAGGGSGAILNDPAAFVSTTLMAALHDPETIDVPPALATVAGLILDHFGPDDEAGATAAVDHLALNVETFVRGSWYSVEMVAAALLRHGRLDEEQFRSVLSVALPAPPSAELLALLPPPPD